MSDLGNLSQCVLDADAGAIGRARRLRRKALLASLAFEAAVVVGLLLWPLVTPGVLPPATIVTPAVPFPHARHSQRAHERANPNPASRPTSNYRVPTHGAITHPPAAEPDAPQDPYIGSGPGETIDTPTWMARDTIVPPPLTRPVKPPMISRVMDAMLVYRVQPEYPSLARTIHLGGTVELRAIIGTDGSVRDIEVVSGNPILARAAVAAVWQWRYQPTRLNGTPVEVETRITVNFILE
ncbi:MAG: TonB family protein [Acidobacteriia bacterium]|nr:TonB family protein [Terriglobia bacterium]